MVEDTMPADMPDYTANPNQRTPCILVLDASASMEGEPIEELNQGLRDFIEDLQNDPTASSRVQVAAICVGGPSGGADVIMDWTDASDLQPFELTAANLTPLGTGMSKALDMIEAQKEDFRANGINYTRPWLVMMSDGAPNDDGWEQAARKAREAEADKKCVIYPLAVGEARRDVLQEFAETPVARLDGYKFRQFFKWLSNSMSAVSGKAPGDQAQLPPPTEWMAAET